RWGAARCRGRSQADRLAHLRHGLGRHGARARVAGLERGARVGRLEPRPPGADRLQLRLHVLDHDLLALEAADAGGATALRLVAQLLGRAVVAMEGLEGRAVVRVAGVGAPRAARVGDHAGELRLDLLRRVAQVDRVAVALAHLAAVGAGDPGRVGEQRLRLGEGLAVGRIEAARDLARELDVRRLVDPDRHAPRLVHEDVGRLQHRVAEEPVGGEVAVLELRALLLVGGVPLEPRHRGQHAEEQVELGVLLHRRLLEERRARRVETDGQPVEDHLDGVLLERLGRRPVGRQRVPVRDEEEAAVLALEPEPVLQRPVVVPEVLASGGARAADDDPRHRQPTIRSRNTISGRTSRPITLLFITTSRTISRPTVSTRARARAAPVGRNAVSTRPPSSGGTGIRLKTASTQLMASDARATSRRRFADADAACGGGSRPRTKALTVASTRFVTGPASATRTASRRGWRSRAKSTGTGRAWPKRQAPCVTGD